MLRVVSILLAFAFTAVACSSPDDNTSVESTTTSEAVTTTAQEDEPANDTTTTEAPTEVGDVAPLTGLPVADDELSRPALAVKIDNHPNARPQTALDQADIVFEGRAEGVTRYMAVFHSNAPDPLGPVRSSRTSDFDLLSGLDWPLYASSGGNDYVANALRSLPIYEVTAISQRAYSRDSSRPAPHNLFTNAADLFALAPEDATAPTPWFQYRPAGAEAEGQVVDGPVTIRYRGSPVVTHTWDPAAEGWSRTQDGRPHTSVAGDQLAPENVVIMVTDYVTSAADAASPELVSIGQGDLFVLTDGVLIEGTWSRPSPSDKPELLDDEGEPILLTPGRTWVLYPEAGQVSVP